MKTPHLLLLATLIFGAGIFAGKLAFQNSESNEQASVNQSNSRVRTLRSTTDPGISDQVQRAQALTNAGDRQQEMILLLSDMVLTDPAQALSLLNEINDEKLRRELGVEAASSWILSDPDNAIAWLTIQPSSPLKRDLAFAMFNKTTARNPLIAKQLFESVSSLNDPKNISKLARDWARSDFEAAKNFVSSQTNSVLKKSGILSIMEEWGRQDPASAIAYLDEFPELFAEGMAQTILNSFEDGPRKTLQPPLSMPKVSNPVPRSPAQPGPLSRLG